MILNSTWNWSWKMFDIYFVWGLICEKSLFSIAIVNCTLMANSHGQNCEVTFFLSFFLFYRRSSSFRTHYTARKVARPSREVFMTHECTCAQTEVCTYIINDTIYRQGRSIIGTIKASLSKNVNLTHYSDVLFI